MHLLLWVGMGVLGHATMIAKGPNKNLATAGINWRRLLTLPVVGLMASKTAQ